MKDICNNEIQAGDMVHVWWSNPDDPEDTNDFLCTVVRTRGRGIKFITDDGKELTKEYLEEHDAQIAIQGSQRRAEKDSGKPTSGPSITTDELEMINKLRDAGWYGTLFKKAMSLSTFKIEMPELQ